MIRTSKSMNRVGVNSRGGDGAGKKRLLNGANRVTKSQVLNTRSLKQQEIQRNLQRQLVKR